MTCDRDTLTARIALSMLPGMDVRLADKLLSVFDTPLDVLQATEAEIKGSTTVPRSLVSSQTRYQALENARKEVDFITEKNITPRWYRDSDYPERLLKAEKAPVMTYTVGGTDLNNTRMVGIVGTRHATAYGTNFTERLVTDLAECVDDIATVSGLAYGIDIAAHKASIAVAIPTIAVVGHGLNRIYPAVHRDIAGRMVRNGGMILTDYRHDAAISPYNFLARNRLVAALCDALVVVESGEQGGALATARLAAKCGTPVFALPGRVTDNYSIGCNKLLANGIARCIQSADDLIKTLGWPLKASASNPAERRADIVSTLTDDERTLLRQIMLTQGCDNDTLSAATGMPASKVMTVMIGLEMRGIVAMEPGNRYQVIQTIDHASLLNK